ncbi:MAG TPA: HlyD family efflux transporter periplasmic adaptor subunit [Bryobacteraceae bacterium]|nr:HlyD family efflux transporter periplasmic adaptor subunit [Bryobacteraceae bacterium]
MAVPPVTPGRKKWFFLIGALVAVAAAGLYVRARNQGQPAATLTVRTAKAFSGTLQQSIRLSGSVAAKEFASIMAPRVQGPDAGRGLVLIALAKAGSMVRKGDIVAQIDPQGVKDHLSDVEAQVTQAQADLRKQRAIDAINLETLRQSIRVAKATLDDAQLDLKTLEIRSSIDSEKLKIAAAQAQAAYTELQRQLPLMQASQSAGIRILEYALEEQVRHRDRHLRDLERFTIRAPINGLVVMRSLYRGGNRGQVQLGDQLSPRQPFMEIVSTSSMQIDARLNQTQAEILRIGDPATISFDAYPGLMLKGEVESVGAMAVGGRRENYYIRSIPVSLSIEGRDPRVIPDLSVSADIVLSQTPDSLIIPREAVHGSGGRQIVYVKHGEMFTPREVETGVENHTQVAVLSGLRAGELVALQQPVALSR